MPKFQIYERASLGPLGTIECDDPQEAVEAYLESEDIDQDQCWRFSAKVVSHEVRTDG